MIFSIYVTIKYQNPDEYKKTRLHVFFSTLASVAIIFVGINIMLSSLSFEFTQKVSRNTKTQVAVEKLWLYPNQLLETSKNIRPEFMASFFMNNPELYKMVIASNKNSPLTTEGIVQEQFVSTVIIQAWEDCLTLRSYYTTPINLWLRSFITWAQSPYLESYYRVIEDSFADTTRQLAELLFEYAKLLPKPVENRELYIAAVENLMKDPRYIALMKSLKFGSP